MGCEFRFMWSERVGAAVMAQSGYGWHIAESTTGVANAQRPRPSLSLRNVPFGTAHDANLGCPLSDGWKSSAVEANQGFARFCFPSLRFMSPCRMMRDQRPDAPGTHFPV